MTASLHIAFKLITRKSLGIVWDFGSPSSNNRPLKLITVNVLIERKQLSLLITVTAAECHSYEALNYPGGHISYRSSLLPKIIGPVLILPVTDDIIISHHRN